MSRISWDIDGTLTNFEEFVLKNGSKYMKQKYNMDVVYPDKYDLDLVFDVENVLIQRGYSKEEAKQESDKILKDFWNVYYPKYCLEPFRKGVRETIERLKADGDEIFVISSRKKTTEKSFIGKIVKGMALLQFILNGVPYDKIIFAETDKEKLEIIKRNYIDIAIEDKPELIEEISKFTDTVCMSNKYNQNTTGSKATTFENWNMYDVIQEKKKEITRPLISSNTTVTNKPSEDKLWLQYYSKTDLKWINEKKSPYDRIITANMDHPKDIAFTYLGLEKYTSFLEFKNRVDSLSKKLLIDGIKKGDKVALLVINTPDTVVMMCALMKIMATIVPISPTDNVTTIENKIKKTDSKLLYIVDYWDEKEKQFISTKITPICKKLGIPKILCSQITNDMPLVYKVAYKLKLAKEKHKQNYTDEFESFSEYELSGKKLEITSNIEYDPNYIAFLVHTGGTVKSKPVMITGENIDAEVRHFLGSRMNIKRGERISGFLPFDHVFGIIINYMVPFAKGVTVTLRPKINRKRLDILFLKDKINYLATIPILLEDILANPRLKNKNLSALKQIFCGSDVITEKLLNRLSELFTAKTIDGYGSTELTATLLEDGVPIVGADIKIVDIETNEELGYNQVGELCVSSNTVTSGYYLLPEYTEKVIEKDENGKLWFHTGDLGLIDLDGKIKYKGRINQDLIKVNGKIINLHVIAEIIETHPNVKKCVVISSKDSKKGNIPISIIQLEEEIYDDKKIREEIMNICKANLSYYEIPVNFIFLSSIPLTFRGKVDKNALNEVITTMDNYVDGEIKQQHTMTIV